MKYTVSFTAWYLNVGRISQLIRSDTPVSFRRKLGNNSREVFAVSIDEQTQAVIMQRLESWLFKNPIPPLGVLLATGKVLKEGDLFTLYHDFYGRGLSKYGRSQKPLPRDAIAELHNALSIRQESANTYFV